MSQPCCFYKQNPSHSYFSATAYNPQEKRISSATGAHEIPSVESTRQSDLDVRSSELKHHPMSLRRNSAISSSTTSSDPDTTHSELNPKILITKNTENLKSYTNKKYTSHFRGVYKKNNKYQAQIQVQGRKIYLGSFSSELEAAKSYDQAAIHYLGEHAKRNFSIPIDKKQAADYIENNGHKRNKFVYSKITERLSSMPPVMTDSEYRQYHQLFPHVNFHHPSKSTPCHCFACMNRYLSDLDPSSLCAVNESQMIRYFS